MEYHSESYKQYGTKASQVSREKGMPKSKATRVTY